jgi:hypothetical protein
MNIQLWGAPFNYPNTISKNIFLHFEPLMYENWHVCKLLHIELLQTFFKDLQ